MKNDRSIVQNDHSVQAILIAIYNITTKETEMTTQAIRPPVPPFTRETAIEKVRLAEDGWNTRDAAKVALA